MSSVSTSVAEEKEGSRDVGDKRASKGEELRQNLAQLKLGQGEGCLRRNRLLGCAANQDYETYSLPVSRVCHCDGI